MITKEKKTLFVVYPNGYGTDSNYEVFSTDELNEKILSSTACISSTASYEDEIKKRLAEIHSRWDILEKV